jgi:hypothetical protein
MTSAGAHSAPERRLAGVPTMNPLGTDPVRNLPLVTESANAHRRVTTWQIALTAFALIAIVTVFFWGINNQRNETAGEQTAATMSTPPQGAGDAQKGQAQADGQQTGQAPSTTGQGDQKDQPQDNAKKASEQPKDSGGEAQRRTK